MAWKAIGGTAALEHCWTRVVGGIPTVLFFQNTAVVGGLLGENVQLNLKVWRSTSLCNANSRRLWGRWRLMDVFRDVRSRDACLWRHRECLKKIGIRLYRVGVSFAEPPGAADLCGSAGCFDGSVVDERGLLVAAGKRAAGEQVNTGEAWSCPTSPPRTHCLSGSFSRGRWAAGCHQLWFRSKGFKIRSTPKRTCSESCEGLYPHPSYSFKLNPTPPNVFNALSSGF